MASKLAWAPGPLLLALTFTATVATGCSLIDGIKGDPTGENDCPPEGCGECADDLPGSAGPFANEVDCRDDWDNDCDGDYDCDDSDCAGNAACAPIDCPETWGYVSPDPEARIDFDACDDTEDISWADNQCGGDESKGLVIEVEIRQSDNYEFCSNGAQGEFQLNGTCDADDSGGCFPGNGCNETQLSAGTYYLSWRSTGPCGPVNLMIRNRADFEQEDCYNGVDDNNDGSTDCEEPMCRENGSCDSNHSNEACDRRDEGAVPGFPIGFEDELGCRCHADEGCDQLGTNGISYVCHMNWRDDINAGVCAPDCNEYDWCYAWGGVCQGDGRCQAGAGGGEICLDGVDDDGDGRTDCEDPDCYDTTECQSGTVGEMEKCNGQDETDVVPGEAVDEFACRCVNDSGCDDIDTSLNEFRYICHLGFGGVCAPDCNQVVWCVPPSVPDDFFCDAAGFCTNQT